MLGRRYNRAVSSSPPTPPAHAGPARESEPGATRAAGRRLEQGRVPPRRSVTGAPGGRALVVKRIPTGGARGFQRAANARREHAVQAQLFAAGLSVPEPLELRRAGGALELVMRRIEGARTLAEVLRERARATGTSRAGLARRLGELLARAHSLGLDHPDLHEKNVLVDARGRPWIIDFDGARVRGAPNAKVARRDLVTLAAATRERTSRRERLRALCAWWRAVDPRARPTANVRELASSIGRDARERRRAVLVRSARRWLRTSSAARELALDGGTTPLIARAELDDEHVLAIVGEQGHGDAGEITAVSGGLRAVREAWCAAARAEEHALDASRPLVFASGRSPRAWFALPRGGVPFESAWSSADPGTRAALVRAFGAFHGALADRGLALERSPLANTLALVFVEGRVHAAAPFELRAEAGDVNAFRARARETLRGASESELTAALAAWREAAHG